MAVFTAGRTLFPKLYVRLCEAARNGDAAKARECMAIAVRVAPHFTDWPASVFSHQGHQMRAQLSGCAVTSWLSHSIDSARNSARLSNSARRTHRRSFQNSDFSRDPPHTLLKSRSHAGIIGARCLVFFGYLELGISCLSAEGETASKSWIYLFTLITSRASIL